MGWSRSTNVVAAITTGVAAGVAATRDWSAEVGNLSRIGSVVHIVGAGILAFLACTFTRMMLHQCIRFPGEAPLFRGRIPYLGLALDFAANHGALLRRLAASTGDAAAFTTYIAGDRMTFIKSPLDFSSVLRERKRLHFHPIGDHVLKNAFKLNIDFHSATYEGWQKQSPHQWKLLRGQPLKKLVVRMHTELAAALDKVESSHSGVPASDWHDAPDLFALVADVAWQATSRAVFGKVFDAGPPGSSASAKRAFEQFDEHFPALVGGAPHSLLPGCSAAFKRIEALFHGSAEELPGEISDVVRLRQSWLSNNYPPHLKGRFQTAFTWAAFANTIPAAFWVLFWILRDPAARKACTADAERVLGTWNSNDRPVPSEEQVTKMLTSMPAIDSAVAEAFRLCVGSITVRRASCSFDLKLNHSGSTVKVREGDRVVLAPTLTHMDPEIYPDPTRFVWDRFYAAANDDGEDDVGDASGECKPASLSGKSLGRPQRKAGHLLPADIALQPFGGGTSMCPGRHLAVAEIKAYVAMVLTRWDIELARVPESNGTASVDSDDLRLGGPGIPKINQSRAGLGILPPAEAVPCRWRTR